MLFFNIVSLYFNTLFNWYINLTIDGTIYPSQHFPFDAALVCQAGSFWTLLRLRIGKISVKAASYDLHENTSGGSRYVLRTDWQIWQSSSSFIITMWLNVIQIWKSPVSLYSCNGIFSRFKILKPILYSNDKWGQDNKHVQIFFF